MVDALRALGVPVDVDGEHVAVGATRRAARRRRRSTAGWPAPSCASSRPPPRSPTARCASTATRAPASARWARCSTRCGRSARASTATGCPFTVAATGALPGGEVVIDASESSQFVSGLLLSGARYEKGVTVVHDGKPVPSLPHIDMSVAMLRTAGVEVDDADAEHAGASRRARSPPATGRWNRTCRTPRCSWPPRRSPAGRSRSPAGPSAPPSPGVGDPAGARAVRRHGRADPDGMAVRGPGTLTGVDVDLHDVGELTPTSPPSPRWRPPRRGCAGSPTCAATRRTASPRSPPSSPRSAATSRRPPTAWSSGPPRCARGDRPWRAYADHRMATAGALVGLVVPGVRIDDVGCTDKTIPDFPGRWAALVDGLDLSAREYDESDVRVRPGRELAPPQQAPPGPRRRRAGDGHHRRPRPLDLRARRRRDPRAGRGDAGPRAGPDARSSSATRSGWSAT